MRYNAMVGTNKIENLSKRGSFLYFDTDISDNDVLIADKPDGILGIWTNANNEILGTKFSKFDVKMIDYVKDIKKVKRTLLPVSDFAGGLYLSTVDKFNIIYTTKLRRHTSVTYLELIVQAGMFLTEFALIGIDCYYEFYLEPNFYEELYKIAGKSIRNLSSNIIKQELLKNCVDMFTFNYNYIGDSLTELLVRADFSKYTFWDYDVDYAHTIDFEDLLYKYFAAYDFSDNNEVDGILCIDSGDFLIKRGVGFKFKDKDRIEQIKRRLYVKYRLRK